MQPRLSLFSNLPYDKLIDIFSILNVKDILRVQKVDKLFDSIALDNNVWRALLKKHYLINVKGCNCKEIFIIHYLFDKGFSACNDKRYENTTTPNELLLKAFELLSSYLNEYDEDQDKIWVNNLLGSYYSEMATKKRPALGAYLFQKAAELGNPSAMQTLAQWYFLKQDYNNHILWLKRASDCGLAEATHHLAAFYFNAQSLTGYFTYLMKAAKQGFDFSAFEAARYYLLPIESEEMYLPLGEVDWDAYLRIEELILSNSKDIEVAVFSKFEELAEKGSIAAAFFLKTFSETNEKKEYYTLRVDELIKKVTPERKERAIYWLEQAAENGYQLAIDKLKELGAEKNEEAQSSNSFKL